MIDLKLVLGKIGWEPTESETPHDSFSTDLPWFEIFSKFGASGFVRTLATDETLIVQAAHPKIEPNELVKALNQIDEVWSQESGFFKADLTTEDFALAAFSKIEALSKVLIEDDVETAFKNFVGDDDAFCEPIDTGSDVNGEFEVIGQSSDEPKNLQSCSKVFGFQIVIGQDIDLLIGISPEMNAHKFERFAEVMIRNLRAKFDLRPTEGEGRVADGFDDYSHRLHLVCEVEKDIESVGQQVRGYLQRLNDLSDAGIDPLVFLGVSDSQKGEMKPQTSSTSLHFESDPEEVSLDIGANSGSATLKKGDFEDQRLRGRDATTALVDVVLRHPGYSDKNMGQVLSILLSIEYHEALELIEKAPTSLAWGVNRERGQMFKTVIEGAGGKVYLSEPGAFTAV